MPRAAPVKVALVVGRDAAAPSALDVLRVIGYAVHKVDSVATARASLRQVIPDIALVGEVPFSDELELLFTELKESEARVVVASRNDAALLLAERLGLLFHTPDHTDH